MIPLPMPYLIAGTALAALLAGSVAGWTARGVIADRAVAELQTLQAQERQRHADAARKAEADARAVEQQRVEKLAGIEHESAKRTRDLQIDAARANAAASSLRQHIARLAGGGEAPGDSGTASVGEATSGTGLVYANVFGQVIERSVQLAEFADRAHAAGLACEASYQALR
jgi:hypothetical protein